MQPNYPQNLLQAADKYADLKARFYSTFYQNKGLYGYSRIIAAVRNAGPLVKVSVVEAIDGAAWAQELCASKEKSRLQEIGCKASPYFLKFECEVLHPNQKMAMLLG